MKKGLIVEASRVESRKLQEIMELVINLQDESLFSHFVTLDTFIMSQEFSQYTDEHFENKVRSAILIMKGYLDNYGVEEDEIYIGLEELKRMFQMHDHMIYL